MNILVLALLVLFTSNALCQEKRFFMPLEIQKAYEQNTRSYNGVPGANYWQNTVDYSIGVTLYPDRKILEGTEDAVYYNNSPSEIKSLVVQLYEDVYKKGNTRLYPINENDIDEGVDLEHVYINGVSIDLNDPRACERTGTKIIFRLQAPLEPKSTLTFKALWKEKLPEYSTFRSGAFDSTTFFAAYWYPQVGVFDDVFGWDLFDYNIRTEFYNNLSNYDVTITAPDKYVVWATGTLINAEQVFPAEVLDKYLKATTSGEKTEILTVSDIRKGFKSPHPVWHFRASEVTDFAFAAASQQIWSGVTIPLKDHKVFISSVLPVNTKESIAEHLEIQQKGLQHFSRDIPGIPYPYEAFTTFVTQEGGGMEYPMMALNGGTDRRTTLHEMFHSYFPMYVRLNERRWAWMDEGITNYNTNLVGRRFFDKNDDITLLFTSTLGLMGTAGDVPLITPSQFLIDPYYRYASYQAPEMVFGILHHYLGNDVFIQCYREFINRWAKKAPTPYDFFYTMENVSGKDLSWLWKPWFFEFGSADLKMKSFELGKLIIVNNGNKPVPVFVEVIYKDGKIELLSENAHIWAAGQQECQFIIPDFKEVDRISINRTLTDLNPIDNYYPSILAWYKNHDITGDIEGDYIIEGYGTKMSINSEKELFYINIPRMNVRMILYPADDQHLVSLDGSIKIAVIRDESGAVKDLNLDWNGQFHAKKSD